MFNYVMLKYFFQMWSPHSMASPTAGSTHLHDIYLNTMYMY